MNVLELKKAEMMAWREKYLAATPAEQERMLAERQEQRIREEEERKRRDYNERKTRFVEKANNQIFLYKELLKARSIALEEIKKFDGKVLNNRLTKIIDAELKKRSKDLFASLNIHYEWDKKNNIGELKLSIYNHFSYGLDNDITLKIVLTEFNDGNRVDWSRTENEKGNDEKFILDRISSWKNAIKSYDKAFKTLKKVDSMIKNYSKENFYLRDFFKTEHVLSNGYYL